MFLKLLTTSTLLVMLLRAPAIAAESIENDEPTIGEVTASNTRGPAAAPVSVTDFNHADIVHSPYAQNLSRLIETVPGIVRFSYDEPVAHGYHGIIYQLDGIPLPEATASNFSDIVDPRDIDSMQILTGAFPAEYGGDRIGAVVNIDSERLADDARTPSGAITLGAGTYGQAQIGLRERFPLGQRTLATINIHQERTNRGIDSPTFEPLHDGADKANIFLRSLTKVGQRDTLAIDLSQAHADYQIPINTLPSTVDSQVSPAGTADTQHELRQTFSATYAHRSAGGNAVTRISPWFRYERIRYEGDQNNDLASTLGTSLTQDRQSGFAGLRLSHAVIIGPHAVKFGFDSAAENFHGNENIAYLPASGMGAAAAFLDNTAQRGTKTALYAQDAWSPTRYFFVNGGLRYDRSTGYVQGGSLSPRLEINGQVGSKDVLHGYVGRFYAAPQLEDTRRAAVVLGGGSTAALPAYDLQPERSAYYEFGLAHTMNANSRWTINFWKRDLTNVLDTTQLANTPIFSVYNSAIGVAKGFETRVESKSASGDSAALSLTVSQSQAGGISGGTFLVCPPGSDAACASDVTLQPEDHDQTVTVATILTKRLGQQHDYFATLAPQYGTGYPAAFLDGSQGRLPAHLTFDAALGREARSTASRSLGYTLTLNNIFNRQYLLKINNGFNSTQYAPGFAADLKVIIPF